MGLPKGYRKNLNIIPNKIGVERRKELLDDIAKDGTYLPKGVLHEDMDKSFIEFIEKEIDLVLAGEKVPVIFLTIQRWGEFAKTWQFSDKYKNIKMPFITVVRKPNAQVGTNQAGYFNIPGKPTYTYMKVPTWDGNRKGMDIYSIPQPVPIDLMYEVRLFCNRMRDLNKLNRKIIQTFSPLEHYIKVNGHPMPILLDNIGDESVISNLDERKYYIQLYEMKLMGYLLDEDDFKVTPAINRTIEMLEIGEGRKPRITIERDRSDIIHNFVLDPVNTPNSNVYEFMFKARYTMEFTNIIPVKNINTITMSINGNIQTLPFTVNSGDIIKFDVDRDTSMKSKFAIKGNMI